MLKLEGYIYLAKNDLEIQDLNINEIYQQDLEQQLNQALILPQVNEKQNEIFKKKLQETLLQSNEKEQINNSNDNSQRSSIILQPQQQIYKNIDEIDIVGYDKQFRNNIKTVFYLIEFQVNDQTFYTKRSYGEFLLLYKEVTKQWPNDEFAPFPYKKNEKLSQQEIIEDRKEKFSELLKSMIEYDPIPPYLNEFLMPYEEVNDFSKAILGYQLEQGLLDEETEQKDLQIKENVNPQKENKNQQLNKEKNQIQNDYIILQILSIELKQLQIQIEIYVMNLQTNKQYRFWKSLQQFNLFQQALEEYLKEEQQLIPQLPKIQKKHQIDEVFQQYVQQQFMLYFEQLITNNIIFKWDQFQKFIKIAS